MSGVSRQGSGRAPPGVVFTTGVGRTCPDCSQPVAACECAARRAQAEAHIAARLAAAATGNKPLVKLRRATAQRGGKVVTLIEGVPLAGEALAEIARALKRKCGAGGTVHDGVIEIQGDQRDRLAAELERRGYLVKCVGG
ncbi:MAG: hypothetical protein EXS13_08750 [Planctomycetes bacterium]|nr:hypothetical protein [Planctomycetota bacterium]